MNENSGPDGKRARRKSEARADGSDGLGLFHCPEVREGPAWNGLMSPSSVALVRSTMHLYARKGPSLGDWSLHRPTVREGPEWNHLMSPGSVAFTKTWVVIRTGAGESRGLSGGSPAPLGVPSILTKDHIATQNVERTFTVEKQGLNVRFRNNWEGDEWGQSGLWKDDFGEDDAGGDRGQSVRTWRRGKVDEFSESSRRRMMRSMQALDLVAMMGKYRLVFGGLTYPAEFPTARASKIHLEILRERIRREYQGQVFGWWKLEPQKRGAPHNHFLFLIPRGDAWGAADGWPVYGEDGEIESVVSGEVVRFESWIRQAWYEIVGSGNPEHWKHGAYVDEVEKPERVAAYVAKYLGKPQDCTDKLTWREPGRFWGVVGREVLKGYLTGEIHVVSRAVYLMVRRTLRRFSIARAKAAGLKRGAAGKSGDWRSGSWRWRARAGRLDTWNTWDPGGGGGGLVESLLAACGVIQSVKMAGVFMR